MTSDDFPFTTNAVLVEQPLYSFFAAAIPARLLLKVAFSDAMEAHMKDDGSGYRVEATQRIIQSKRLTQIAGYIDREDSGFPNAIILAANFCQDGLIEEDGDPEDEAEGESPRLSRRWTVEADGAGSYRLTIPSADKLAAIIDGQHRLFAFAEAKVAARLNMNLLCSIFLDLPKPYQAQIFATINSNQKPVDKSLTYELFGYNIDEEPAELWSPDKLAVFLTRKLSVDLESPLRGRVSIAPLLQAIAANQGGVFLTGEDQTIDGPQQEPACDFSQGAEPADQGMFEGTGSGRCLAGSRQMPARRLARVAVNHQRQSGPAIAPGPNPAQVCRSPLVGRGGDRGNGLDAGAHADRALANLPAFDPEDALHRVLVDAQKPGNRAVADGSFSIMALIGSAKRGSTFGAALVGL